MTGLVDMIIESQKVALEAELLSLFKDTRVLTGELLPDLTTDDKLKIVNGFVAALHAVADELKSAAATSRLTAPVPCVLCGRPF